MRFKRITKEKGCLKKLMQMEAPSDGLLYGYDAKIKNTTAFSGLSALNKEKTCAKYHPK